MNKYYVGHIYIYMQYNVYFAPKNVKSIRTNLTS